MSKPLFKGHRISVRAAAALWCLSIVGNAPVMAASNLVAPSDYDDVGQAEKVFFGRVDTADTYLKRLDLLEIGIFGRVRSGSQEKRLQRIASALGLKSAGDKAESSPEKPGAVATAAAAGKDGKDIAGKASDGGANDPASFKDTTTGSASLKELLDKSGSTTTDNFGTASATAKPEVAAGAASGSSPVEPTVPTKVAAAGATDQSSVAVGKAVGTKTTADLGKAVASKAATDTGKTAAGKTAPDPGKTVATKSATNTGKPADSKLASDTTKAAAAKKPVVVFGKETPKIAQIPEHPKAVDAVKPAEHAKVGNSDRRLERPSIVAQKPATAKEEIDRLFKQGMSAFQEHRNKEAQTLFKQILVIDPRNVDAYFNLGSMAEANHDYLDALTFYRAALATNPADKDLKKAVGSMENELYKQRAKTASGNVNHAAPSITHTPAPSHPYTPPDPNTPFADVPMNAAPIVPVGQQTAPITDISSTDAPIVPAQQIDPKTFSLQTAENGTSVPYTPLNAANAPYQQTPIYGVPPTLSGNIPAGNFPIRNITPNNPNRNTFGYIFQAGAGIALRGSGLHCPICRVMGGLH